MAQLVNQGGFLRWLIGGGDEPGALVVRNPDGSVLASTPSLPLTDTKRTAGKTAAAPGAFTTITGNINVIAGEIYEVIASVWQSGTPDANALNARILSSVSSTVLATIPTVSTPSLITVRKFTIPAGDTTMQLTTEAAAGGAGSIYNGLLLATRIG